MSPRARALLFILLLRRSRTRPVAVAAGTRLSGSLARWLSVGTCGRYCWRLVQLEFRHVLVPDPDPFLEGPSLLVVYFLVLLLWLCASSPVALFLSPQGN